MALCGQDCLRFGKGGAGQAGRQACGDSRQSSGEGLSSAAGLLMSTRSKNGGVARLGGRAWGWGCELE